MTISQQNRRDGLVLASIALQVVSLAIWWEWFHAYAFGNGSVFGVVVKLFILSGFFALWSFQIPLRIARAFGADVQAYREQDALAGLPLVGLLFIIPLAKPLAVLSKTIPTKLFGFVWVPWWSKSMVISTEAKWVLLVSGVFIVSAAVLKSLLMIRAARHAEQDQINTKKLFWLGLAVYALVLSWSACMQAPQSGEIAHWLVTQSLSYEASFNVDGILNRGNYYQYYPLQKITFKGYTDVLGRLYLPVAPGMPLLFIAFYLLQGRWLLAVLAMALASGAMAQLYGLCREQQFSARTAFLVWLAALGSAPMMIYGYQQNEVTAAAFFLMLGIRRSLWLQKQTPAESVSTIALAAFAGGALLLGGVRFFVPATILIIFLVAMMVRYKHTIHFLMTGLILLAPVLVTVWYSATIYRFFLSHMPYTLNWPWELKGWLNLIAVFFDRYTGIVWSAPLWTMGMAGMAVFAKSKGKLLPIVAGMLFIAGLVSAMVFPNAWGEGSSYHRFVAPAVLMFGLGLAAIMEANETHVAWRRWLGWLGWWSAGCALLQTVFPFLAVETGRIRMAVHFQPLGWLYDWMPSFKGKVIMIDVLLGAALVILLGFALYRMAAAVLRMQPKILSTQSDEKPKPRIQ